MEKCYHCTMNSLLKKEKILYNTMFSHVSDKRFVIAFQDYVGFLAEHGTDLLLHLGEELTDRNERQKILEKQQTDLTKEIIDIQERFNQIADELNIKEDNVITSSLQDLSSLIDGSTVLFGGNRFYSMQSEIFDFIRRLIELGHTIEAREFLDHEIKSTNDLRDKNIPIRAKIQTCVLAEEVFNRQDMTSLAGALQRILDGYREIAYLTNTSPKFEATTENFLSKLVENRWNREFSELMSGELNRSDHFGRRRFAGDLERIHNSILLNNDEHETKQELPKTIFSIKDGNIYHHSKPEKLTYKLRGEGDPTYIKLFKNILKYMPANQEKISIKKFKELLPSEERSADKYRSNVGKSAKSFHNFLRENGVDNLRPDTREMVLEATDDYITFRNNL